MSRRKAIDIAMEAQTNPGVTALLSVGPLPEDLKTLLRIVAEGQHRDGSTEQAYSLHGAEKVRSASASFLAAVLFGRKTDPYRALGLPPGASLGEVRENKRLLLKWLHPDRNPMAREQEYLSLVIEAAEAIEGGRVHAFSGGPRKSATTSPRQSSRGAKTARADDPRRRLNSIEVARVARRAVASSAAGLLRAAKLSGLTLAVLLCSLIAWRLLMGEPIGASIERYSNLVVGLVSWN